MTKVALAVFLLVLSATFLFAAQADRRYVQLLRFPGTGETVVIAEGDLEPRSIGSYTMRVYKAAQPNFQRMNSSPELCGRETGPSMLYVRLMWMATIEQILSW